MFNPTSLLSSSSTFNSCISPASASSSAPESQSKLQSQPSPISNPKNNKNNKINEEGNNYNKKGISKIQVSRQKYIPVSKSQLHDALLSFLRDNQGRGNGDDDNDDDSIVSHFVLLSSCLDSILHAEHKSILEEMRADYLSTQSVRHEEDFDTLGLEREREPDSDEGIEFVNGGGNGSVKISGDDTADLEENQLSFLKGLDLMQIFGDIPKNDDKNSSCMFVTCNEINAILQAT